MTRAPHRGLLIVLICICSVILLLLAGLTVYLTVRENQALSTTVPTEPPITTAPVQTTVPTTTAPEVTTEPTTVPTEDPSVYEPGKLGKIVNIMVVGQSWRPGEDGKMADTMILCTVNKETKTLTMTSFLRDTYVKLANYKDSGGTKHSCGNQRLNVAYALGYSWGGAYDAMGMLNQTIEENFLIDIDYNVEVDFDTFVKVIDTLGGIEIELNADEATYMTLGSPGLNRRIPLPLMR